MERAKGTPGPTLVPVILLAFAGAYAWLALRLPPRNIAGTVGVSFVPLLLAALLALLALLLLGQALRHRVAVADAAVSGWLQAGTVLGMMALYIGALDRVGFLLATPPYLAVTMWLSGGRRPWSTVVLAVAITGAVWLVFWSLFRVPLPRGALF